MNLIVLVFLSSVLFTEKSPQEAPHIKLIADIKKLALVDYVDEKHPNLLLKAIKESKKPCAGKSVIEITIKNTNQY